MPRKNAKPVKVFDNATQFNFIVTRLPANEQGIVARLVRRLRWLRRKWYELEWYAVYAVIVG